MKTAIHNTQTNTTEIRDVPQWHPLPEHYILLQVIRNDRPVINAATYKAVDEWQLDLVAKTYTQVWVEIALTEAEQTDYINQQAQQAEENRKELARQRLEENEIEVIDTEAQALTDEDALENMELYPAYKIGILYLTDERFVYPMDGKLYKVLQTHTSALQWKPGEAVSLYVEVFAADPDNLCETAQIWSNQNWPLGTHVKHDNAVWVSINETHTWIAPDHTGNGAISWEWVQDCTE